MQSIYKNGTALAVGGLVAQLAFVAIEIIIARQLGNETYGVFASVYMAVLTITLIVDMGLTWYSVDHGSKEPSIIPVLMGTTTVLKIALFAAIYPVLLLAGHRFLIDPFVLSFFSIFYFYGIVLSMQDSLAAVNSARESMHVSALFQGVGPLIVGMLVFVASWNGISLNAIAICYLAGTGSVTLLWWLHTQKAEKPTINLLLIPGILKKSSWYGATNVLAQLFYKSDIIFLSFFSTMPQVGIYAAGYKILDIAYKIPILAVRVFSPPMYKQFRNEYASYVKLSDVFIRLSLTGGAGLTLFCLFASDSIILTLFGADFSEAALILKMLSACFILKFTASCLQTILSTMGMHRYRTQYLAIATATLMTLHVILIPRFGAMGAAASVVFSDLLLCILFTRAIPDLKIRRIVILRAAHCLALATLSIASVWFLTNHGIIKAVLASIIFVSGILLTRFLSVSDIKLLTNSANQNN